MKKAILLGFVLLASVLISCESGNSPEYLTEKATSFLNSGEAEKALPYLSKLISKNPQDTFALVNRAQVYSKLDSFELSVQDYSTLMELDYRNAGYAADQGYAYYQLDQLDEAKKSLNRAIQLDQNLPRTCLYMGMVLEAEDDLRGAIALYSKAIELKPDEGNFYYCRGTAYHDMLNLEAACADWEKMAELKDERGKSLIAKFCKN